MGIELSITLELTALLSGEAAKRSVPVDTSALVSPLYSAEVGQTIHPFFYTLVQIKIIKYQLQTIESMNEIIKQQEKAMHQTLQMNY